MLYGQALSEFGTILAQIGHATNVNLNHNIFGLGTYLFSINSLSKQNSTMCHFMRNILEFKVRRYAVHTTRLNKDLEFYSFQ